MGKFQHKDEYFDEYRRYLISLGADNSDTRNKLKQNLKRAIKEEITPKEWQAIELYYIEQMKMTDIAEMLGVNVSTISRNIKRGIRKLRRYLRYGAAELLKPPESGEEE